MVTSASPSFQRADVICARSLGLGEIVNRSEVTFQLVYLIGFVLYNTSPMNYLKSQVTDVRDR